MAIFHLSVKTVSRGKGQSVIAKAAYNARDNLRDEQTGKAKDYARAAGLVFSGIFAPKDAPACAQDREALWNEVERNEKRKDAQLAREITLGLPHELTGEQRRQLVTDFVREQFQRKGMVADVNIHAPSGKGDDRNHHAHVLLTMREIGPDGFGAKVREWNSRPQLETWREEWERIQNRYLERHGHEARVDRRTLEAQGIEREPTTHLGPHAHAMEQSKGIDTERGRIARDTITAAQETAKLKRELAEIDKLIAAVVRERQGQENSPMHRESAPEITPWVYGTEKLKRELAEVDKLIAAARGTGTEATREKTTHPAWERTSTALHFEDAARIAAASPTPDNPAELRGTAAQIWEAYNARSWTQQWEERQPDGTTEVRERELRLPGKRDPYRFAEALEKNGIRLAVVTKDDAEQSYREAEFAKAVGNRAPVYREGEFVGVNRRDEVYRFTGHNTGDDPRTVQSFLAKADWKGVQGVEATRQVVRQEIEAREEQRQVRSDEIAAARAERATNFTVIERVMQTKDKAREIVSIVDRGVGLGVRAAAVVFGAAANAFESLIAPPRTKTIGEMREINERQVAAGAERDRAFEKFLYDEEHEYFKSKQKEQVQQRQTERDYYERQKQNERER